MNFEEIEKLGHRIMTLKEEKEKLTKIRKEDLIYNSINLQSGRDTSLDHYLNIRTSKNLIENIQYVINGLIEKRIKDINEELESITIIN